MAGSSKTVSIDGVQFAIEAESEVVVDLSGYESESAYAGNGTSVEIKKFTGYKSESITFLLGVGGLGGYQDYVDVTSRGPVPIVIQHSDSESIIGTGFIAGEKKFNTFNTKIEDQTIEFTTKPRLEIKS